MKEHGYFCVKRTGQVIMLGGRGPWNAETLRRGSKELNAMIDEVDPTQPWAQLSFLCGESVMPPSVYNYFASQKKQSKKVGLAAIAIVIINSNVGSIIKQQLSDAYHAANIEHAFFDKPEQARLWLQKYHINITDDVVQHFIDNCNVIRPC